MNLLDRIYWRLRGHKWEQSHLYWRAMFALSLRKNGPLTIEKNELVDVDKENAFSITSDGRGVSVYSAISNVDFGELDWPDSEEDSSNRKEVGLNGEV